VADFDAKADTPAAAAAVAAGDKIPFGDVSADAWDTIEADDLLDAILRLSATGVPLPATSPAQITGNQNNYSPGVGPFQRWDADAARTVTGVVAGAAGELRLVWNVGSFPITLSNESASSTAANRLTCAGAANLVLGAGELALLSYSGTTSRWLATKVRSDVAEGTLVVRQPGGVAGTDEVQIYHDGNHGYVENRDTTATAPRLQLRNDAARLRVLRASDGADVGQVYANRLCASDSGVDKAYLAGDGGVQLTSDRTVKWSSTSNDPGSSQDSGLSRAAAGVVKVTDGSSGGGWLQPAAGRSFLASAFTDATGTLANVTGLTHTLAAGRKYSGILTLFLSTDQAAEGAKLDFDGGTATMTSFSAGIISNEQGATVGVGVSSALATDLTLTALNGTGLNVVRVAWSAVVNAGGTFIPRLAQNSHTSGTLTAAIGSNQQIEDMP